MVLVMKIFTASSSLGRNFHKMLKQGEPNLIVVAPGLLNIIIITSLL